MPHFPHHTRRRSRSVWALITGLAIAAATLVTVTPAQATTAAPLQIYPAAAIYSASSDYTLTVNDQNVPVTSGGSYDTAQLAMGSGTARIRLTKINNTNIGAYSVSPRSLGISATVSGSSIEFTIDKPSYLIAKIDGRREVVIAIDPWEADRPADGGAGVFNVTAAPYNAVTSLDGSNQKAAFQQALNDAAAWGTAHGSQGIVYVPAGVYQLGTLYMRSNLSLYLEPGAVLRYSGDRDHNEVHWHKKSQNRDVSWFLSTRYWSENITVHGRGIIDGNGKATVDSTGLANNLLAPIHTSGFRLDGITFRESSSWAVIPTRSDNLHFTNMKIFNRLDMGENDGIDVMESQHVSVTNAIGIALDDPFSTKTWDNNTDLFLGKPGNPEPLEDVTFDGLVTWSLCYGVKVGQGVQTAQTDVRFRNIDMYSVAVGIGVHHKYGSATASNILFENIRIERFASSNDGLQTWLAIWVVDGGRGVGPIQNVTIRNVTVDANSSTASRVRGLGSAEVSTVKLEQIRMPGASSNAAALADAKVTDTANVNGLTITP